ncbi:enoyl-CoA hydratase-related protein [Alkalicoccus urumqiensis]|uniref:Enoyl-CoA hydratase n=1 Tax=Alkalicoccus urumqiensis TaxID=1548213 RepID=A0A2P6MEG8_ALKUR|nr:enoyl-CoA hydratase-related protein [Alkalicoccus urumqiensis]PRO64656.1 enoyl-CoA hydratase [Alkalicoccus urumqiensis]
MIETTINGPIASLYLNRPEAANALSSTLLLEMTAILETWAESREIRAVILGARGKTFCAGADLKERLETAEENVWSAVENIRHPISILSRMPQPVIAAVQGGAVGGGMELTLACDFRIASERAQFQLAETGIGVIPGAGGTQRLPALIGMQRAKEMILAGRKITGQEAAVWGLALKAVPHGQLYSEAEALAYQISRKAPLAVRAAKYAMDHGAAVPLEQGMEVEKQAYQGILPSEDRLEGLRAFQEKRAPEFHGR